MLEQFIFYATAVVAVLSALSVIFNKNVVHSALFLLVNFTSLAVLYFILNAQFLGVAQILVYAGAIVVLFLFVVMLIGADLGEKIGSWFSGQNLLLMVLGLILLTVIGTAVFEGAMFGTPGTMTQESVAQFGQTQMLGAVLFTQYTLPFQLVAVLLSVGGGWRSLAGPAPAATEVPAGGCSSRCRLARRIRAVSLRQAAGQLATAAHPVRL
jgi:NADH-quinone oxidoreductase subunit J